jgi:hypothetical protein
MLALCLALATLCGGGVLSSSEEESGLRVAFVPSKSSTTVRVTGLKPSVLNRLASAEIDRDGWNRILSVSVAGTDEARGMLGEYRVEDDAIVFEPRFPLRPDLTYRAAFDPAALPGSERVSGKVVTDEFSLPDAGPARPAEVTAVYPTGDTLPENQLKFYLHFSAPMSRGEAYQRITLIGEDGQEIDYPFLELGEELWDPSGRRFTLFFDPGRIKRGLQPRKLFGPALETGKSYTLAIDQNWPDARGRRLARAFTKKFRVTDPDDVQPDPSLWKIAAPAAGTRDPLSVTFEEPLDHGMLNRVLVVAGPAGAILSGRIDVDRKETRWHFHPDDPWTAGRHQLVVETTLEDLAGNSIGRPFEVDVVRPIARQIERKTVSLPFDVARRRSFP